MHKKVYKWTCQIVLEIWQVHKDYSLKDFVTQNLTSSQCYNHIDFFQAKFSKAKVHKAIYNLIDFFQAKFDKQNVWLKLVIIFLYLLSLLVRVGFEPVSQLWNARTIELSSVPCHQVPVGVWRWFLYYLNNSLTASKQKIKTYKRELNPGPVSPSPIIGLAAAPVTIRIINT